MTDAPDTTHEGGTGDLADATARALVAGYRDGSLSPVAVLEAVLARIDACEPTLHALYAPDRDAARAAAAASEARWRRGAPVGPLDGVPITIKENIATAGVPVPLGTAATHLEPAAADAPPAARVREAGAVLVAKTTMPDYGMLTSGLSSFHPLARNPWDPARNPGGSSAGAAAAAAAGYGPLHLGSDIGGSLRLPAGWTGIASLKPSWGRVPIDPTYWGRVVGPMARTVADNALLMSVLSRSDPGDRDHASLPPADVDWQALDVEVAGLRVGVHLDAGAGMPVDDEVTATVQAAADVFAAAGATVEAVAPFFTDEQLADLDLFWRVRGFERFSLLAPEDRERVLPYIADWVRGGEGVDGTSVVRCANRMLEVGRATVAATHDLDLVLSPVCPVPAPPAEWPSPANDVTRAMHHIAFTVPYNFSHQPALSVNAGFTAAGLPIGVQLAGRRFDDLGVLRAGAWFEQARPEAARPTWPPPPVRAMLA